MPTRLLAFFLLLLAGVAGVPASAETVVIHAGRLIVDAGRPAQGPSTITIVDGRIQSVTDGTTPAPQGARVIDLSSRTVLPGLIDAHVHFMSVPGSAYWREAVETIAWETGDILLLGSGAAGPAAQVFLGSAASKILRHAPVPVMIVPRHQMSA